MPFDRSLARVRMEVINHGTNPGTVPLPVVWLIRKYSMKNYTLSTLLAAAVICATGCDSADEMNTAENASSNKTTVNSSSRVASTSDRQIEDSAEASYNYRTVLDDKITVKADKGVVTLTGKVDDRDHRELAADTVSDMPGVVRVNNEITVSDEYEEHSDGWIAMKIRGVLLTKANVSVMDSQVQVEDGNVILTGKADNQAQKELTEVYAKEIEGVKTVKNKITVVAPVVKPAAADDRIADRRNADMSDDGRTLGDSIDDASITAQVKATLLGNRATSALKTKVTTRDGVVALSGIASSDAEKSLVTKLVQGIRGVKSVENSMTVKSSVASN